jgi:hypothetical protein
MSNNINRRNSSNKYTYRIKKIYIYISRFSCFYSEMHSFLVSECVHVCISVHFFIVRYTYIGYGFSFSFFLYINNLFLLCVLDLSFILFFFLVFIHKRCVNRTLQKIRKYFYDFSFDYLIFLWYVDNFLLLEREYYVSMIENIK